jgi:tetratricopeptide (TPR) repeat protein
MNTEEKTTPSEEATPLTVTQGDPDAPNDSRWPPAAALLNLTGLGLGYLYLKRQPRWLVHLAITTALLVLAYRIGGSAGSAALWWGILGLWLLWMALDGWRQARRRAEIFPAVGRRAGRPAALAVLLLAGEVALLGGYLALGHRAFDAGMAAYREADCRAAMQHLKQVTASYNQFTLGSKAVAAGDTIVECSLLVFAGNARDEGQYADAVAGYRTYLFRYPRSPLDAFAQDAAAETYHEWALDLQQAQDYAAAIEKSLILLADYAGTSAGGQAPTQTAGLYSAWAAQLQAEGQYGPAIEKYLIVLNEYAATPAGTEASLAAAEAYAEWAADLQRRDRYAQAIARYHTLLSEYPGTPPGRQAATLAAQAYAEWAGQLRQSGDYAEAVARYLTILSAYPATPAAAETPEAVAETYVEWAGQLQEVGNYDQAIANYRVILSVYPDTAAGEQAPQTAAQLYAEWADQLRESGQYDQAVANYQAILSDFPDTPSGALASRAVAEAYAEWAMQLREADEYEAAIEKYRTIASVYPNTPAGATAALATAQTYAEWAAFDRAAERYAAAIEKYETLLEQYPNTALASTALVAIGQTYNEWGKQLYTQRKYTQAMETYTQTRQITNDAGVIAAAEEGFYQALYGLSQDGSGEGRQLMDQTLTMVCAGEPALSPAVGLAQDEAGRALFGGDEFALPGGLEATKPANLSYAICLESGTSVLQNCPYTGGFTLVRQRRWWRLLVRDTGSALVVADRTFYGAQPEPCPLWRSFASEMDYSTGGDPAADEVITWLQDVVR